VVIYNMFARAIGGYRVILADLSAAIQRLVSRDLDRRGSGRVGSSAAAAE
jgi:biopolymer transport protein ExbB